MKRRFTCNVCGGEGCFDEASLVDPEAPSCAACLSNVRHRWLVHRLSFELFGRGLMLPHFPESQSISGLGLSDPPLLAEGFARSMNYRNTFYHSEPLFDIRSDDSPIGDLDFLIASEVFEHVTPPVELAFKNAFRLLKPGGVMLLTTPWVWGGPNREHFPLLHQWAIEEKDGQRVLRNVRADGGTDCLTNLVFHGGSGLTLEMRVFSRSGLETGLCSAGFADVEFEKGSFPEAGIVFPYPWSRPIVARKSRKRM
jgi:SAM-dependent methyltransferase